MSIHPTRLAVVLAFLVLALSACGGGGDEARDSFVAALSEGGEVTEDQAGCVYDRLAEDLDDDQIAALENLDAEPDDPAVAAAAIAAFEECLGG
jgi:hypothetical protein